MRKLGGYMLGLTGLAIYVLFAARLGEAIFPMHIALEILYYAVAGIGWIFPAMWIIRWWVRPRKNK